MRNTNEIGNKEYIIRIGKQRGITLLSLIITIIIMLILVSVTITIAVNGGLFGNAGKAVRDTKNAIKNEHALSKSRVNINETWYDSIDDYLKGNPSLNQGGEERDLKISHTLSEGEELWNSKVTLTIENTKLDKKKETIIKYLDCETYNEFKQLIAGDIDAYDQIVNQFGEEMVLDTIAKEQGIEVEYQFSIEQMREIAAYMTDCSSYDEFKTIIEQYKGDGTSYEEICQDYGGEEFILVQIISIMKPLLSYKDVKKLESMGIEVITVKTPYDTLRYTSSLGGTVECILVENGEYTFSIYSGATQIDYTIEIDNIRNYDEQGPHDIKIEKLEEDNKVGQYVIDDSEEWKTLSDTVLSCNNSLSCKTTGGWISYVIKDKEYYKYFSNDLEWRHWCDNRWGWILSLANENLGYTTRQIFLALILQGDSISGGIGVLGWTGEWADYMDEYVFPKARGEIIDEEKILQKYPKASIGVSGNYKNDMILNVNFTKDTHIYLVVQACLTTDTYVEVVVWDDEKKRKIRIRKKLKDVTYEDELVVWDFDKGEFTTAKPLWIMKTKVANQYNLLKLSDGSELKTIDQHRIFNKEAGKFTYPMTDDTPIGTTTYTAEGKEVKLVSKEVIVKNVEYTNIITKYHINVFANNILTSCRFSNLYPIQNMKYIKDNRDIVDIENYKNIPEEYYYGLRLGEQLQEVNIGNDVKHANSIEEHIQRVYLDNAK